MNHSRPSQRFYSGLPTSQIPSSRILPLHLCIYASFSLKMLFSLSFQIWLKSSLSWMCPPPLQPRRPFLGSSPALFFVSYTSSFIASYLKSLVGFLQVQEVAPVPPEQRLVLRYSNCCLAPLTLLQCPAQPSKLPCLNFY